jgi:hypothetical protein
MGIILTAATVLALATQCQHSFPPAMILAIAEQESLVAPGMFDAAAIGARNRDGSRDYGLMQINSGHLTRLGLSQAAVMDPCINIAATEVVLREFSAYNSGNPTRSADYARRAYLALRDAASVQPSTTMEAPANISPHQTRVFARKAKIAQADQNPAPEEVVLDDRPEWTVETQSKGD